ncbi:putative Type II secretion system protein [Candidatus Sulfotelmatobacter sp. SbA7]|nr:putative Type II secretion system protein [Candidatus Sulfotelmatobacter sp. SbA7]
MKSMLENDFRNASPRESSYTGEPLSVVGICLDDETWRFLNLFAGLTPSIRVRSRVGSYRSDQDQDAILEQLGQPAPEICLLDFDTNRRAAVMMAERIHASLPGVAIFAVSSHNQPSAILEAMRCGCSEYLAKPIDREQLANAVVRIGSRRKEKRDQSHAQLLAFMGAKGGCGTTTMATQLGALLAGSFSRKALLLDLHPDFGDAALYLKLTKTRYHFFELLENTDRMDADFLESFLMRHSSGLELIPAPEGSVGMRGALPPGALSNTLDFLRPRYEFILVDLPPALNDENLAVVRDCDQLYLVTVAEVSAVRNVVRQLEYFRSMDIPREKIRVVLNRHHKRNVLTGEQIEKVIEQKIFWRVPNHYPQVVKTISEGDPIAQLANSEVTRSLEQWAAEIGEKPGAETKKKEGGGLLGLWNR